MRSKLFVSAVLVFFGFNAVGGTNVTKVNFDDELIKDEWIGADRFVDELNSAREDSCKFILKKSEMHSDTSYIIRRVLLIGEKTKCVERSHLVSHYLNSPDVLVKATAIRLAATLNKKEKIGFKKKIEELRKAESDSAIQEAVSKFLQD